jgi:hypothetical protein
LSMAGAVWEIAENDIQTNVAGSKNFLNIFRGSSIAMDAGQGKRFKKREP